jgi:pimeloyl-ACP methyl ester carboxylesterase
MTNILFIPGIKGTELHENQRKVWFPNKEADLNAMNIDNELEVGDPISLVNAFNWFKVNIYKGFFDEFNPEEMDYFSYDWRHDITQHVDKLLARLLELSQKGPVTIVAHSMGGMLAKLGIQALDEIGQTKAVNKLITLGTPWFGSADAFKALAYGEPGVFPRWYQAAKFLDDKKTRKIARQFPAVYQLLPSKKYYGHADGKFLKSKTEVNLSYEDMLQRAQQYYNNGNPLKSVDIWKSYMEKLQEAMLQPLPQNIEHDCLIGVGCPTVYTLPDKAFMDKRFFFKGKVVFKNGDGVVPLFSAIPEHQNMELYYVESEHVELCSNKNTIEFIRWCLNGKPKGMRPNGIDLEAQENLKSGVMAIIKCPVDTTILDENGAYIAGEFDTSIENVSSLAESNQVQYLNIGESKFVYFSNEIEKDITVKINSYETGIADISVEYFDTEEVKEIHFEPLPVERGEVATAIIPLSSEINKASLHKANGKSYEYSVKKKKNGAKPDVFDTPIPGLEVTFKEAEDTNKSYRRWAYSGPIFLNVKIKNVDLTNIYYSVDDTAPVQYDIDQNVLDFSEGEHTVTVFGKDNSGRPLVPVTKVFSIVKSAPKTKFVAVIKPDVLEVNFVPESFLPSNLTPKANIYYRISYGNDNISDWIELVSEKNELQYINWGNVNKDLTKYLTVEYYSVSEFGYKEDVKSIKISLGDIPQIMWREEQTAVTPEIIWNNVIKKTRIPLEEFTVVAISKTDYPLGYFDFIKDDVKGVRFDHDSVQIDVMHAEKYSLYFKGSPTEVLQVGENYKFSFELLAERTKEKVVNTDPKAFLKVTRSKEEHALEVFEKNGTFYSSFTVDESFLKHKYRLIITDKKNVTPPLRDVALIMKETDEE